MEKNTQIKGFMHEALLFGFITDPFSALFIIMNLWSYILPKENSALETVDIGNFQRPVFSLGVSQHMHNIINL